MCRQWDSAWAHGHVWQSGCVTPAIGNHRLCSRGSWLGSGAMGQAGVGLDASFGEGVGAYNESTLCIYRALWSADGPPHHSGWQVKWGNGAQEAEARLRSCTAAGAEPGPAHSPAPATEARDRWALGWGAVACGQILQDEENTRRGREELSPAQTEDNETTYPLFSTSGRPFQLHIHRKAPWGPRREGVPPHNRWCQPSHRCMRTAGMTLR